MSLILCAGSAFNNPALKAARISSSPWNSTHPKAAVTITRGHLQPSSIVGKLVRLRGANSKSSLTLPISHSFPKRLVYPKTNQPPAAKRHRECHSRTMWNHRKLNNRGLKSSASRHQGRGGIPKQFQAEKALSPLAEELSASGFISG